MCEVYPRSLLLFFQCIHVWLVESLESPEEDVKVGLTSLGAREAPQQLMDRDTYMVVVTWVVIIRRVLCNVM